MAVSLRLLAEGKGDAVVSLRSEEFFNELDRLAEAGKGVTKEQVEVLRTSNKVVYGFAVVGKLAVSTDCVKKHSVFYRHTFAYRAPKSENYAHYFHHQLK